MKTRILYSSIVASLLLVACRPYAFNGSEFPELLPAADFELMRADGQPSENRNIGAMMYNKPFLPFEKSSAMTLEVEVREP